MPNDEAIMILAILQARCSSSRLPGKVLMPIVDVPMIWHQWQRMMRAKHIGQCVLATSTHDSDDVLANYFLTRHQSVFRGSLKDVLDRFYQCATQYQAKHSVEHIVRLTGDCPLIDPEIIDRTITYHVAGQYDYTVTRGLPNGINVEVCRFDTLEKTHHDAHSQEAREHVTYAMYQDASPFNFKLGYLVHKQDLSAYRLTVDYPEDLSLVRAIYAGLYHQNNYFNLNDIIIFLENNPSLKTLNAHIVQKSVKENPCLTENQYS